MLTFFVDNGKFSFLWFLEDSVSLLEVDASRGRGQFCLCGHNLTRNRFRGIYCVFRSFKKLNKCSVRDIYYAKNMEVVGRRQNVYWEKNNKKGIEIWRKFHQKRRKKILMGGGFKIKIHNVYPCETLIPVPSVIKNDNFWTVNYVTW